MKTQTLKINGFGQRSKTKLLLLCIIILFSGACKKELYENSIAPPSQNDRFLTELYNNLLKNDAQYHILDQLQPSDKLGWERMMIRYRGGRTASSSFVLPVIREGTTADRLIQFSFSRDNKLVNISLLSYDNNLRLPIASDSLNSSYVKNQQTANILACMSKDGLVVNDKLSKRASSIAPLNMQKIASPENLKQARPQALMSLPDKAAGKPIGTNANIMSINYGSSCTIIVDFDFLYIYSKWISTDEYNLLNYAYHNYGEYSFDRDATHDFDMYFTEFLSGSDVQYEDRSTPNENKIAFFGLPESFGAHVLSIVQDALHYAAYHTAMSQGHDISIFSYYLPSASYSCPSSGGGYPTGGGGTTGTTENPQKDIRNKTQDPCISKTVNAALISNNDIEGMLAGIIQRFDNSKTVTLNIFDGATTNGFPGQYQGGGYVGNKFQANITLQTDYFNNSSKESVISTVIHEFVHAYIHTSGNNILEGDHDAMSKKYITPMATYLQSYFGIEIKEAYALAWSGVPDSKAWYDAPLDFEFTMSDGNKITKQETMNLSGPYKDNGNQPIYKKGTPLCN